jgi:aldehyde dehydrogenase (NAD+)
MEVSAILAKQRKMFDSGATLPMAYRRDALKTLAALLEKHEAECLQALYEDLRKSPYEAYASEIGFVLNEIRYALRNLASWMKPQKRKTPWMAWPARCDVRRQPFGVALIIGPWNYPLQLLLSPLVGAIAAGNCAVLKPSELAPHTSALLVRLLGSAFPEEYIAIVPGEREVAESLLAERFDGIFFTGSSEIGKRVMAAAARHLTPVTLELGGKCPCIVCHDTPLKTAARRIVWGKFMNAGQTCVAPDHLWVDARVFDSFVIELRQTIEDFFGNQPQLSNDYGRIIHRRHFDRLVSYLSEGKVACGGVFDADELYIAPTVITDVPEDALLRKEEIFGPILPVFVFAEIDSVLDHLRKCPKPLALYLFTEDASIQQQVISQSQSGGVCVNDTVMQILGRDLPFGGIGESGMGQYHGRATFECFSHPRVVMKRSTGSDPEHRYPPMKTPFVWLKRLLRYFG